MNILQKNKIETEIESAVGKSKNSFNHRGSSGLTGVLGSQKGCIECAGKSGKGAVFL